PELFTNQFFTVNTGRHKKLSFAAVFSYKQNNQQFICRRLKGVNNAGQLPCDFFLEMNYFQKVSYSRITLSIRNYWYFCSFDFTVLYIF
ncbi:MAG: hypothetical protein V2I97_24720, partial [Desulfococcaceae bacterium]|nr:hypothetical protein [Desulfococcaceae bacterium]